MPGGAWEPGQDPGGRDLPELRKEHAQFQVTEHGIAIGCCLDLINILSYIGSHSTLVVRRGQSLWDSPNKQVTVYFIIRHF